MNKNTPPHSAGQAPKGGREPRGHAAAGLERLGLVPGEGLWDGDSQAGNSSGNALVVGQRERPYCHLKNLRQKKQKNKQTKKNTQKPPPGVLELERFFSVVPN